MKKKGRFPKEPVWYKQYCKDLSRIYNLPKSANDLLMWILQNMNEDNHLTILGGTRSNAINDLDIAAQTLRNRLADLVKSGLIAMDGHGVYVANPYVFSKKSTWGDTLNMQRKFRAMFEYSGGNRKITSEWLDD